MIINDNYTCNIGLYVNTAHAYKHIPLIHTIIHKHIPLIDTIIHMHMHRHIHVIKYNIHTQLTCTGMLHDTSLYDIQIYNYYNKLSVAVTIIGLYLCHGDSYEVKHVDAIIRATIK